MTDDRRLNVTHTYDKFHGPVQLTFSNGTRFHDDLAPYITTVEADVDSSHYRPGGQRHDSVSLALPASRPHIIGVVLKFTAADDVAQLIAHLEEVKSRLEEKLTRGDMPILCDAAAEDGAR